MESSAETAAEPAAKEQPAKEQPAGQGRGARGPGRRFQPGQSGNPAGARSRQDRVAAKFAVLARDFPEPRTGVEDSLLGQAARLLDRAERAVDGDIAVRCANAAARILASLRNGRRAHRRDQVAVPLREQLAREAEPVG